MMPRNVYHRVPTGEQEDEVAYAVVVEEKKAVCVVAMEGKKHRTLQCLKYQLLRNYSHDVILINVRYEILNFSIISIKLCQLITLYFFVLI